MTSPAFYEAAPPSSAVAIEAAYIASSY